MIKIVANHEMIKIVTKYEDGQNIVTIMNSLATPTEEPTSSPGSDCTDVFSKESEEVRLEDDHDDNDDVDDAEVRLEDDHDNNDDVDDDEERRVDYCDAVDNDNDKDDESERMHLDDDHDNDCDSDKNEQDDDSAEGSPFLKCAVSIWALPIRGAGV